MDKISASLERPAVSSFAVKDTAGLSPFRAGLEFNPPARGVWNIVHIAMLLPESYVVFVCPAGCMRGVILTAAEMGALDRFSSLLVTEDDVLTGNGERLIIDGVSQLLDGMEQPPRALHIFTSCVNQFMGTDLEVVFKTLAGKYPHIHFLECFMTPTMRKSSLPPLPTMNKQLYSLLPVTEKRRKAVNIIGSNASLPMETELLAMLENSGYQVRDIRFCNTFEEYQQMAESMLNITVNPNGLLALRSLETRLGQEGLYLPITYDYQQIGKNLRAVAEKLEIPLPDIASLEEETSRTLQETARRLEGMPVVIDSTMTFRPFGLAKLLSEHGFQVTGVYAESCSPDEAYALDWLREHNGSMQWSYANHPTMSRRPAFAKTGISNHILALGQQAAYFAGTNHFVNVVENDGLYGFHGIRQLCRLMLEAAAEEKDARRVIQVKGLGCKP